MKVSLVCESPLLQKSLEIYLKPYLSTYEACDFVITDREVRSKKPVLVIGKREDATLQVPFSKEEALSKTQLFFEHHLGEKEEDDLRLEEALASLKKSHREKIEKILKEFHAKG